MRHHSVESARSEDSIWVPLHRLGLRSSNTPSIMIIHGINLQLGNYRPLTQLECEEPKFSESLKLRSGNFVFLNQSEGRRCGRRPTRRPGSSAMGKQFKRDANVARFSTCQDGVASLLRSPNRGLSQTSTADYCRFLVSLRIWLPS